MSMFSHFIDIFFRYVDGADMYRKRDFLITSLATCSKNGDFLSHPNHIEDKLDMVCQLHDHFPHLGKWSSTLKRPTERLMQQRLLQLVQGGELALVEGFEALGFFAESVELGDNGLLLFC